VSPRLLLLALVLPAAALAANKTELQGKQGELRERIETLKRELAKSEESHASAADQLRATESAISDVSRRQRQLAGERAAVEAQIGELEEQTRRLDRQTVAQQDRLARLLNSRFTRGEADADAVRQMLSGRDPNQAAIDDYFLKLLSRGEADLIADLRQKVEEKKRLTGIAQVNQAELAAIEKRQQEARALLLEQQRQRQAVLVRVADRIRVQRKEMGALQRDEKRLAKLIEGLARLTAKPKTAPVHGGGHPPAGNERGPDLARAAGAFAALRGRLPLPVRGEIASRFGAARADGGSTWKGLFIRSAEGTEVKAVAPGRVVFADWLRGFGNLLILDHGDGFLSVYGNNESVLREAGAEVKAGEAVATVGNSGGNPESGLYFELRYQGHAFDPLKWAKSR